MPLRLQTLNSRGIILDCQKGTNLITEALKGREFSLAGASRDEAGGETTETQSRKRISAAITSLTMRGHRDRECGQPWERLPQTPRKWGSPNPIVTKTWFLPTTWMNLWKGMQPCWLLDFSLVRPRAEKSAKPTRLLTCRPQINSRCFKPLILG